jgi:transposase InsO family protein
MADAYEIAAWRFEQIAPLLDASLTPAQKRQAVKERCRHGVLWPLSEGRRLAGSPAKKERIARSTLHRWAKAFREKGYEGLFPRRRSDRGRPRTSDVAAWVVYAIALLYEQPHRGLTQIETYLRAQFPDYAASRSTLARHLRAHPAYEGARRLATGAGKKRRRDLYEAGHPHECWQLDGKGPFRVRFKNGDVLHLHVLTVIDDFSRCVLACVVAREEDLTATVRVFEAAVLRWGLPERIQFDRGSAFDAKAFREGLAQLGVHRNFIRARSPEWDGKIEAYHRSLKRWFVRELEAQEVVDLVHLEQLLHGMVSILYNRHHHRSTGQAPEARLAGEISLRRVSAEDLSRAFFLTTTATSHPKTGEVRLPTGSYRVPVNLAGGRGTFRYHPVSSRAVLVHDEREVELEPFAKKPLPPALPSEKRGRGQLQRLVDLWQGKERPNAEPGFGLPEVFAHLAEIVGHVLPRDENEAREVLAFYRRHGPLAREAFEAGCRKTKAALGAGRPLNAYLEDLERQVLASRDETPSREERER